MPSKTNEWLGEKFLIITILGWLLYFSIMLKIGSIHLGNFKFITAPAKIVIRVSATFPSLVIRKFLSISVK